MEAHRTLAEKIAKQFGCTLEQLGRQYRDNAKQLEWMADKAKASKNGIYNKMPESYWREKSAEYYQRADACRD
jgi:hypothetical protein